MKQFLITHKRRLLLLLTAFCIVLLNLSLIFNDSVWYDEAYTMNLIRGNWNDILYGASIDVHPPLYYFIVKFFTIILGYSVPAAKIASITPVILTMLLIIFILDKQLDQKHFTGTFFCLLLLGTAPCSISMNIELRMYTWAMFFVTGAAIFAFKFFKEGTHFSSLILLTAFAVCAAYTHYFALIAVAIIYVLLLFAIIMTHQKNLKYFFISCIVCFVSYLPLDSGSFQANCFCQRRILDSRTHTGQTD